MAPSLIYRDLPAARGDDWTDQIGGADMRLAGKSDAEEGADAGGLDQARDPAQETQPAIASRSCCRRATTPCFAIRKPVQRLYRFEEYLASGLATEKTAGRYAPPSLSVSTYSSLAAGARARRSLPMPARRDGWCQFPRHLDRVAMTAGEHGRATPSRAACPYDDQLSWLACEVSKFANAIG